MRGFVLDWLLHLALVCSLSSACKSESCLSLPAVVPTETIIPLLPLLFCLDCCNSWQSWSSYPQLIAHPIQSLQLLPQISAKIRAAVSCSFWTNPGLSSIMIQALKIEHILCYSPAPIDGASVGPSGHPHCFSHLANIIPDLECPCPLLQLSFYLFFKNQFKCHHP